MLRTFAGSAAGAIVVLAALIVLLIVTPPAGARECGLASWYGTESGNRTASGEAFTGKGLTAAHRSLPFGTRLRVSYGQRSVVVRINDRGPFIRGRVLDLSRAAAQKLGLIPAGVARVCWVRVK